MRDLDWADVEADAHDMRDDYFNNLYMEMDVLDTVELQRRRYYLGVHARREADSFEGEALRIIDTILLSRLATTLCEGCLDRTGCDMCNPPMPPENYDGWYGGERGYIDGLRDSDFI